MATLNVPIHFFDIKNERKAIFIEDMHEFAILTDNDTFQEIHYPNYESAKLHSDMLNALGNESLVTKVVGTPWRIYLKTWQETKSDGVYGFSNEELFYYLINLKVIADDELFSEWKSDRERMIEICKEQNIV